MLSIQGLGGAKGEKKLLGTFTYRNDGPMLQVFAVDTVEEYYRKIRLEVLSNYGNKLYTCLYRFRAHGTPMRVRVAPPEPVVSK